MKITVLNKSNFNKLMIDNGYTPENIGTQKDLYIISINDTNGEYSKSYFENTESENVLKLYFDDTEEDSEYPDLLNPHKVFKVKAITDKQALQVISFLEKIKVNDNTNLLIHCTAGQNRSGSIGKFASDFFNYGYDKFMKENSFVKGNSTVTSKLNRLYMWSNLS
jgi:protein tyrosine phosphatase